MKTTLDLRDDLIARAKERADHSHHETARRWLSQARRDCVQGREPLMLLPMVITSFLRLVTNPRVFAEADSVVDAVAFVEAFSNRLG